MRLFFILLLLLPLNLFAQTDVNAPAYNLPLSERFEEESFEVLPNTGRIWSILENQEASSVVQPLDTGGLEAGNLPLFGSWGGSWTESQYLLNGFNITDPYQPGRPMMDVKLDALSALEITSAAKSPAFAASGASINAITQRPSRKFQGAAQFFFSSDALQNDNSNTKILNPHFNGEDQLKHLVDGTLRFGGKMPSTSWPFFASFSVQNVNKNVTEFPAGIEEGDYDALAAIRPIAEETRNLDLLFAAEHLSNPHQNATAQIAPSATTNGKLDAIVFQSQWDVRKKASKYSFGLGLVHSQLSAGFQDQLEGASSLHLPENVMSGSPPFSQSGGRTRWELNATFARGASRHTITGGVHYENSTMHNEWRSPAVFQQIFSGGQASNLIRWNSPAQTSARIQNFAVYAQDSWKAAERLHVPLGLRLENSTGHGTVINSISWTSLEPRVGLIALFPAKISAVGTWARYGYVLQGNYFDSGDPAAPGAELFLWSDSDANGLAESGEAGILQNRRGSRFTEIDHDLKQPYTNEVTAGVQKDFRNGLHASVRFFRRDDRNNIGLINTGVPFSAYAQKEVLDPGNDGMPGTSDDALLMLFNRDPAFRGKDLFLLTNPPDRNGHTKGFEIAMSKAAAHWNFSLSFTGTSTTVVTNPGNSPFQNDPGVLGNLGSDPNTLIFAQGTSFFDRGFTGKLRLYYLAPAGFHFGLVARYYDGLPFGRLLFVNGFNQGPFFVRATPRANFPLGYRTEFNATLDLRIRREFVSNRHHIFVCADVFNLINMGRRTIEYDITGPDFRVPVAIQSPRMVRLGIQWKF